jgi:hypothetical protein
MNKPDLIVHDYKGFSIPQRKQDGFVNLTALCKSNNKQFKHWNSCKSSKVYVEELSNAVGIPASELLVVNKSVHTGTWAHKLIAIEVAKWISPAFALWCNQHLLTLMEDGTTSLDYKRLPSNSDKQELKKENRSVEEYLDYIFSIKNLLIEDRELTKQMLMSIANKL